MVLVNDCRSDVSPVNNSDSDSELIMEKNENWHLQKCSLGSLVPNISFLSKPLNLIGCHGNRKAKFEKTYSKIFSSEAIRGIKLFSIQRALMCHFEQTKLDPYVINRNSFNLMKNTIM